MTEERNTETVESNRQLDVLNHLGHDVDGKNDGDRLLATAQVLWSARGRILRWTLVGAVTAVILALIVPPIFLSTARLMPPENASPLSSLSAIASMVGGGAAAPLLDLVGGGKTTGSLFVGVLQSRSAQERVVDDQDLGSVYGIRWLHWRLTREKARRKLADRTIVSEDKKSGIISITVEDSDPKRAAALADSYVKQLNFLLANLSTSSARREREFLEGRLKEVQQELTAASQALSQFASKNTTIDPKEQGKAMVEGAALLQGQLIAAESEMRGLQAIYTDENVRVRATRARIAELKKQLEGMSGSSSITASDSGSDMPYPSIRQLPLLGAKYADFYRRAKIQEVVFEILNQQYEIAKVQEAKEIPTVKVLDNGNIPDTRSSPQRKLWTVMGALFGLMFAVVWTVGQVQWRELDPQNPYKLFILEVARTVSSHRWLQRGRLRLRRSAADSIPDLHHDSPDDQD